MFLRLIWRLVRQNISLHYVWPLVIAIVVESTIAWWRGSEWYGFQDYWFKPSHLVGLFSVYITFLWVIAHYVKQASDVRSTLVQTLDDILPDAKRYFAIGVIPLNEWFDPDSQVYLATIIRYQYSGNLRHERVLLLYTDYDLKALNASYLDEHYARCLLAIHKRFVIPLGFLGPTQIRDILMSLSEDSKRALSCHRRFARILPVRWQMRKRPDLLPFAFIVMNNGTERVLKFRKGKTFLRLDEIKDQSTVNACKEFVTLIESYIYAPNTNPPKLKHEFDLDSFFCP